MLRIYSRASEDYVEDLGQVAPGCRIELIAPGEEELRAVAEATRLDKSCFQAMEAGDGCPRVIAGERRITAIVEVPVVKERRFDTILLTIVLTPDYLITACKEPLSVISEAELGEGSLDSHSLSGQFFTILHRIDRQFLRHIHYIRKRSDEIEQQLRTSLENKELFQLLDFEKGLTYFTAALRANVIVLESLLRLRADPHLQRLLETSQTVTADDMLETVIIENKRALQLAEVYTQIMGSMMDAFSSVIAHNLNRVIKFLASITVLISIPTVISSFWSMSMAVPWQRSEGGFLYVLALSFTAMGAGWLFLKKRNMF